MRQIKFKYYMQHEDTGYITSKVFELEELESYDGFQEPHRYFTFKRCQFTGLYDKQGVEIYEGDTVKFIPSGEYGLVTTFGSSQNLGIEWKNSRTAFFTPMFYLGCETELEIIGNIYENKELLS